MSELQEFAENEDLKRAYQEALRKLDKAKRDRGDVIEAVYQAAHDAAIALDYEPVPAAGKDRRRRGEEHAIAVLSDWQLAKVTPDYNSDVCADRVKLYADKVATLAEIQRADHPVKGCHVFLLGDLVEGELVFPGQAHRIDSSLFRQTHYTGPGILGDLLRRLLTIFEWVHVEGVIGNHGAIGGRSRREMHPETNADAMLYRVTELMLSGEERLTFGPFISDGERHWYRIAEVAGRRYLLFHGDQIRGYAGVPWYGFDRKLKGWFALFSKLIEDEGFDYALSGHFHTPFREYVNGITHWGNGSTESHNTYAAEQLASAGEPAQWLLFADEEGVTAEYLVRL